MSTRVEVADEAADARVEAPARERTRRPSADEHQPRPNPLREGLRLERMAEPCTMVICGATGDLTERKLAPALYNSLLGGFLPPEFTVVGFARRDLTDDEFREHLLEGINKHSRNKPAKQAIWESFAKRHRVPPRRLRRSGRLRRARASGSTGSTATVAPTGIGSSTSPSRRASIPRSSTSSSAPAWRLRAIAAAAGRSAAGRASSSRSRSGRTSRARGRSNRELAEVFDEEQVYRIDHYLGKETVQNLAVFRFGNGLFEPIWNRRYIDSVQITVAETVGVEGRGEFYDATGALRDIVQGHALQLMAIFAMDPPVEFHAEDLRDEKLKVLRAVKPMSPAEVATNTVRGQYVSGWVEGAKLVSYRDEPEVAPDSRDRDLRGAQARDRLVALGRGARSTCAPARGCRAA